MEQDKLDKIYEFLEPRITKFERRRKDSEDRKTVDEVFDKSTLLALYKLMSDGAIDMVDFPISTGKEGNVFRAELENQFRAIKIYRISTSTFKTLSRYVLGDPRFKAPRNHREMIFTWAKKEFKNLKRARKAGISVPEAFAHYNNILVMRYIGTRNVPAPQIRDVCLDDAEKTFDRILEMMRLAHQKARLVHGDLSEYNILYYRKRPYIIDWAQAVVTDHPMSREWLDRDVNNIVRYFNRIGVKRDINEVKDIILES